MTWEHILISQENLLALRRMGQPGQSPNDVISELLREIKKPEIYPETFDDYWQLYEYFIKFQAEIKHHNRLGVDRVSVRITTDKPYSCHDVFYRKEEGKYRKYSVPGIGVPEQ